MASKETEQIVEDTIKYANEEIKRIKNNYLKKTLLIISILIVVTSFFIAVFKYEKPLKYNDKMVEVVIPEGKGIDIKIDLPNYSSTKAVLVKVDEEYYDLYINVTTTLANKIFKDEDKINNLLRVGNGMIVDYQSEALMGFIPSGLDSSVIKRIYYVDNLLSKTATLSDNKLTSYKDKTLIWERE